MSYKESHLHSLGEQTVFRKSLSYNHVDPVHPVQFPFVGL